MIFQGARVFLDGQFVPASFSVQDGLISGIGCQADGGSVDLAGRTVLPGLVELHSHGCAGHDFSTASGHDMGEMLAYYQSRGVTSVLGTTMTMSLPDYRAAVSRIREVMESPPLGSRLVGINMEGPFLSPEKKGAHDAKHLCAISEEVFEQLDELSGGAVRIVDLAPDLPGAMAFIDRYCGDKVVSIAHSPCGYETASEAFHRGARHVTHLFNAMNGLHHRDPGIVGAFFDHDANAEIICDGVHIHGAVIRMLFSLCPEKMILVSDSMSACGLGEGQYILGGLDVTVKDGKALLEDGTIAGSARDLYFDMVQAIRFGVREEDAVLAATLNPAKAIGMQQEIGRIAPGCRADFLVIDDSYRLCEVWQDGKLVCRQDS